MAGWGKDDAVVESKPTSGGWGANDTPAKAAPAPVAKEEPGWFMPGSKSEAAMRGFSQGATLGFGDEIQALMRTIGSDQTYAQIRDEERGANAASAKANPVAYGTGNIAAALPTGVAGLGKTALTSAARSAGIGGAQGLGTSNAEDVGGMVGDAAQGAAIQGVTAGALTGAGNAVTGVASKYGAQALKDALPANVTAGRKFLEGSIDAQRAGVRGSNLANLPGIAEGVRNVGSPLKEGLKGAYTGTKDFLTNRAGGAGTIAGTIAFGPSALAVPAAVGAVQGVGKGLAAKSAKNLAAGGRGAVAGPGTGQAVSATVLALQNMSGQDARKINTDVRAQIDQQAAEGRPVYAATFQALNQSPAYRVASEKVASEPDAEDDEE